MRRRAATVALALLGLASAAAPAGAATPTVEDGFTLTGRAGGRVRVRVTAPLLLEHFGRSRVDLSAGTGPLVGLAFVRGGRLATYAVGTTPVWSCGAAQCQGSGDLVDFPLDHESERLLPAGTYDLVLVGAPGALVTATVGPPNGRRPPVLRPTRVATTTVFETPAVGANGVADPAATGTFDATLSRPGILGLVQNVATERTRLAAFDLALGPSEGGCDAQYTYLIEPDLPSPLYATKAALQTVGADAGAHCGRWIGANAGAPGRLRGFGFFVPLA